mgnify:FL=1
MAIIDTLHQAQFVDEFRKIRKNDFSIFGLRALFQYLDEMSEDCGQNIEFDPIGFCCEFSEYNLEEFNENYGDDIGTTKIESFDELQENEDRVIARFTSRDFVDGEWIEEEKVLVHHG